MFKAFVRFLVSGIVFLFLMQIRVGEKTLERHLLDIRFCRWVADTIDYAAHQSARLMTLAFRHGQQIYHEMKHPSVEPTLPRAQR